MPIVMALLIVVVGGYILHWSWTGYQTQPTPPITAPETHTLWDWLEVSLLPLTLALTPVWLTTNHRHRRKWRSVLLMGAGMFGLLVLGGYTFAWGWTGFAGNTMWDWLQLFLVPFALPVAFHFLAQPDVLGTDGQAGTQDHHRGRARGGEADRDERTEQGESKRRAKQLGDGATIAWAGTAAAAVWLLVAAVLIAPAFDRGQPRRSLVRSVVIDSRDPVWTDTGLLVVPGDELRIVGFGWVLPSHRRGYRYVSPAGVRHAHPGQLSIEKPIPHAALIATVAAKDQPLALAKTHPAQVIAIAKQRTLTIRLRGELLLGINDKKTSDNTGSFGATVTLHRHAHLPTTR